MSRDESCAGAGDPSAGEPPFLLRAALSLPTSPDRGAAAVAVAVSGLSVHRPEALPELSGNDDEADVAALIGVRSPAPIEAPGLSIYRPDVALPEPAGNDDVAALIGVRSPAPIEVGLADAVSVGEWVPGFSTHRPDVVLPELAGNEDKNEDFVVPELIGVGAPAPIEDFDEVGLAATVLRDAGYKLPTPLQRFCIPTVMAGRDIFVASSAKSTGKTAAFCLPVVTRLLQARPCVGAKPRAPRAVIIASNIPRVRQISNEVEKCSRNTHLSVVMVISGIPIYSETNEIQNGVDILVGTPGYLVDMVNSSEFSLEATRYFIVDDLDKMLDMGLELMIRKLVELGMPQKLERQTLVFTATLRPEIERVASDLLSDHITITFGMMPGEQIPQKIVLVSDLEKQTVLLHLLAKEVERPLTLIFVETTWKAYQLSDWLCNKGFAATCFLSDRTQKELEIALRYLKSGLSPILVSSHEESWGLDVQNITHVINYDLPKSIEGYIHRIRRTGKCGLATSFFTEWDQSLAEGLTKVMTRMKQNAPDWLVEYAHKLQHRDSDPHFDYLVEKFVNAITADVQENSSFDDIDYKEVHQRQTDEYANSALLHYNCQGDKEVKYELVEAITSCGIKDIKGLYMHVNFTAKSTENSKVDFFFAELRWDSDKEASVPTCVVTLEENQRVGGFSGTDCSNYKDGMDIRVDPQHCYACGADLKHPMDGGLYEIGHKAMCECYGYDP